jgi:glycosyltransferase involved in cell wall biosynthesis
MEKALQQAPSNLEYLGPLPIDQVNEKISQSDLLLYTSLPVEGFGSSFTQAWLRQVPTVSLSFELDGILEQENIGRCSRDFEHLVTDVKELMEDESLRRDMGQRARAYAVSHHSAERMVADYEALFKDIVRNSAVDTSRELRPIQSQS